MKKTELLIKSREAMMSAVQLFNNPQITFKSETFITLAIIAWTYLLHAFYANEGIDYRYFHNKGKKKYMIRQSMELINIGSLSVVWIVKILQSIP